MILSMTSSDIPKKYEGKIESIEDFYNMKLEGFHETQGKDGYWKMSKPGYFPVRIPQHLVKTYPAEFAEKIPMTPGLFQKIAKREADERDRTLLGLTEELPETKTELQGCDMAHDLRGSNGKMPAPATSQQPGTFIAPSEFILHDTARRALESVWVLEGLYKIEKTKRHELPFAHVSIDAKGNPQAVDKYDDKKQIVFSLADLAVYFLIDCYIKYQKADETIAGLNVEKMMLHSAYMNEKEKLKELEDAMMLQTILKI